MTARAASGRFRCDECRRVFPFDDDHAGYDCGESNWFCWRCQEAIENREAIIEARIERKHGVVLSGHAVHMLAHYGERS